jgi:hypothetical protein
MFTAQAVLKAFKYPADKSDSNSSHCRMLDARAKELGYKDFHHFRVSLKEMPQDQFGKVSLKVMRYVCASRLPQQGRTYYEFRSLPDRALGFYSHWIGWDSNGDEVRTPRPLEGRGTAKGLRGAMSAPVYVIESAVELNVWRTIWHSTALIPAKLAKETFAGAFDKRRFVAVDPPYELIEQRRSKYDDNFATVE